MHPLKTYLFKCPLAYIIYVYHCVYVYYMILHTFCHIVGLESDRLWSVWDNEIGSGGLSGLHGRIDWF